MYNEFDDCFDEGESDEMLLRMMEEEEFEDAMLLDSGIDHNFDDHDLDFFDEEEAPF